MIPADSDQKREVFFKLIFGAAEGLVCIAALTPNKKERKLEEFWFKYPQDLQLMQDKINVLLTGNNVYFCPHLFRSKHRKKDQVLLCPNVWSDLDECDPQLLLIEPTVALETSPGRYQALWVMDHAVQPEDGEEYSKRIAYQHSEDGADRSGWDLTQLLRIPYTYNYKYESSASAEIPYVKIVKANTNRYRLTDLDDKYPITDIHSTTELPMPSLAELRDAPTPEEILESKGTALPPSIWDLFQETPQTDSWSEPLWKLQMLLFEAGCTRLEVYVVAKDAACNKYARDKKPDIYLWREVCRAFSKVEQIQQRVVSSDMPLPDLITPEEIAETEADETIVERYITWASSLGDAAPQYHQASAFILLSTLLSGVVRLPTSFGSIIPNLWFMILADTTLTRKSTAMDIAMDLLEEIDSDAILATDGSLEGMMTALSTRPGRPSIFLRDEFSGLLEAITKKDYMAGMAEILTKLYDGRMQKRILKKEVIEVREPVLILFTGGIRNRIQELLRFDDVSSGFVPRFVFITAESDVTRRQALGPPTSVNLGERQKVLDELQALYAHYNRARQVVVKDGKVLQEGQRHWEATLTPEAWERYNQFENAMVQGGVLAARPDLMTPVFDRLSKSMLKAAVLIAASKQRGENVIVDRIDIVHAIYYARHWRDHVIEVVNSVGQSSSERTLDRIMNAIHRRNGVMLRAHIMQHFHLNSREMDLISSTLEQRNLVTIDRLGKAQALYATKKGPTNAWSATGTAKAV